MRPMPKPTCCFFEKALLRDRGCVLNEYLYYFYYREKAVENILNAGVTRGEVIRDINRRMTEELSHIDIENDFESGLACFEKWYGQRENAYMANETGIRRDKPRGRLTLLPRMRAATRAWRSSLLRSRLRAARAP